MGLLEIIAAFGKTKEHLRKNVITHFLFFPGLLRLTMAQDSTNLEVEEEEGGWREGGRGRKG